MNLSPISNYYNQNSVSIFLPLDGHQNPQNCIKSIFRRYCKLLSINSYDWKFFGGQKMETEFC